LEEFVKRYDIVSWDQWNAKNENKSVIFWFVDVLGFVQEEVRGLIDKWEEFTADGHFVDMSDNFD